MKAIIVGAGRGSRLMPTTADEPKCFAKVDGRRILDWILEAFAENGVTDVAFVGGYRIESVREAYPGLRLYHNADWERNNILVSLMHAEPEMDGPFLCSYADILYTPGVVRCVLEAPGDIVLSVDTAWRDRYGSRSQHPEDDAEKVATDRDGRVVRVHRDIPAEEAHGEYIGLSRFSSAGARSLVEEYHRARGARGGGPFREAARFERAYLIQLLQEMIEAGVRVDHVDTPGGYIEVDTQEDYDYARRRWHAVRAGG